MTSSDFVLTSATAAVSGATAYTASPSVTAYAASQGASVPAFATPPGASVVRLPSARRLCPRRPRSAPTAVTDDDFVLPAIDIASLANNTVLGGERAAAAKPRKKTIAQQRAALRQKEAAERRAAGVDDDHGLLRAARDVIDLAGVDVSDLGASGGPDVTLEPGAKGPVNKQKTGKKKVGRPPGAKGKAKLRVAEELEKVAAAATVMGGDPDENGRTPRPRRPKSVNPFPEEGSFDIEISDLTPLASAPTASTTSEPPAPSDESSSKPSTAVLPVFSSEVMKNKMAERTESDFEGGTVVGKDKISRQPQFVIRPKDLVMHARHGVGRFRGLERTSSSSGPTQEYAVVEYRDGDVYVPLSQLESLRRLSKEEGDTITALDAVSGSGSFNDSSDANNMRSRRSKFKAREKARAKIREQLVNLHGLYAARESIKRPKYPSFLADEAEFLERCEFELTPDQKVAVAEVLKDVSEVDRPMDRLLCGDVGFGKTEVALQAAFRILLAGKQVAILAPTTILAQQHFETLKGRLEDIYPQFPVCVLTRFTPRKSVLAIRERIANGEAKVIVGTHILLGDTTKFKNLGLLIVDEEHRFGVNQKEKLRSKHRRVDTLFMSATPIPRTLHLALSGLRDTSVLKMPPPGRKPVITRVAASGSGVVRKALSKEFKRDGQVFFVVPRIEGIEATGNWLQDLFPEARILIAHGQHKDLERRILSFSNGEYDILVCTSIIENGINMPKVNTMVVQDAARFGMAQLHQLRGRVGRCDLQAYTWLLYTRRPGGDSVPAHERLRALERFSGLGAGFAIAQRDMEMRGVGTVLGVDQHGYSSLDAEDYSRMLVEELEAAKTGKPVPMTLPSPVPTTEVFLPVASFVPPEYVTDVDEKMSIYGALSKANSTSELASIGASLESRYGPLPVPVHRHLCIMRLKLLARKLGIRRILVERQHVVLDWAIDAASLQRLVAFLEDKQARVRFEVVEEEEKVNLRGLAVCSGDLQLAKLLKWLDVFVKASVDFALADGEHDEEKLLDLLGGV